jgi:hypothetical protein
MMMKKISLLLLLLVAVLNTAHAQLGHEWIVAGQQYYKFSTAQDGIYAVTYSELQAAGVDMNVDPRRFQLWHRGVEQNILIEGEDDGQFNSGDRLLFYGKRNDGTLDANLYRPAASQPHQYYNLYNDTTAFFLTWGAGSNNKRMLTNPFNTALTAEPYHMKEYLKLFTAQYSKGIQYNENAHVYGDRGETWCGPAIEGWVVHNETVPISSQLYNTDGVFTVEVMIVGRNMSVNRNVKITISNLNGPNISENFPLFSMQDKSMYKKSFSASMLQSGNLTISIDPTGSPNNRISLAYVRIVYPERTNSSAGDNAKVYNTASLNESNYTTEWPYSGAPLVFNLTDKNNVNILRHLQTGTNLNVFVPSNTTSFKIQESTACLTVPVIRSVDMEVYPATANFLILSHQKLWPGAVEYANYRSSAQGGGYNVLLADVDKVYNLFSYGELTPVGIRNFCLYNTNSSTDVKSLFLIGKGTDLTFQSNAPLNIFYRHNPNFFITNTVNTMRVQNFIPPAGTPSSDIFYTMNASYRPNMAVGRLSARDNQDIYNYLNKVKEHETLDSSYLWRKKIIHLSGGENAGQISAFKGYMDGFKQIAETSLMGAKVVKSYVKDLNNGTVDQVEISEDVNEGLGLITFFGHSSSNITDLDIGYVSNDVFGYRNKGKYPMLLINGCNSASTYYFYSLAEDWVQTADRGAIAVIGTSDQGYTSPLRAYSDALYRAMYNVDSLIGKSIGEVMKRMLQVNTTVDSYTASQMNLHGDPRVVIYGPRKTDYEISGDYEVRKDQPELKCFLKSFNNNRVTAAEDSFMIGIPVKNFGIYNNNLYYIQVKRMVNGNETVYPEIKYPPVRYLDTLYFTIRNNNASFYGLNRFTIFIDSRDTIPEMNEFNNTATIEYFMSISGVTCIFPKEYSVVHGQPVTFVAQSTNLMIDQKQYYFELDTSYLFNSAVKQTALISSGSVVRWPNVSLYSDNNQDSIVYYWRVRYNEIAAGEDTVWGESSFIYIKNSPDGWSQSEAPQFVKSGMHHVHLDLADSTWKFNDAKQTLVLHAYGNGDGSDDFDYTIFKVGEVEAMFPGYWYFACGPYTGMHGDNEHISYKAHGIVAVSLDKNTVENYGIPGYGLCGRYPKPIINSFSLHNYGNNWMLYFTNWLNTVPNGDYILIGSNGNAQFENWPAALKEVLEDSYGAQKLGELNNGDPYILLARKGDTQPLSEKYSNDPFSYVVLDTVIAGKYSNGVITSTRIGPSQEWGTFYQRVYATGQDQYEFKILGERLNGTVDTLNINLNFVKNGDGIDTLDLKPLIDANVYPYIRLICNVYDSSVALDPPQLDRWQVIYHKVPEGTMDPFAAGLSNYQNISAKDQGAKVCFPYVFENISDLSFGDSLYVRVLGKGEGAAQVDTSYVVYVDSLTPGKSFSFNACLNTKGLYGRTQMRVFVNPNIQPEEYYSNNVIETHFEVIQDKTPPVIDVTFDGVHIMDGDIVSPSPLINIILNDNNKYLMITDPNDISIYFKKPNSSELQILPSNPDILRYGQTPGKNNTFSVEYHPQDLPDGEYTIMVQGRDANGNKSGQYYKVTFKVENASTISNFYPYPNPFSTSTRFVFTLTGRYVPDDLKIQIMTVTGKVVREITKEELGHIHIGNNKTEYAWDGTDEFGDRLANGVYLYRVLIKNKGDNFEHRNTAGDKAFKKDFGKIYILR